MGDWAYVNGEFCDLKDAVVSVEDRGFQFADGIYEGMIAYAGRVFRMPQHLDRLRESARQIQLPVPWSDEQLGDIVEQGLQRCGRRDTFVYMQITRGVASRFHAFPVDAQPTLVMTFKPRPKYAPDLHERGSRLITIPDERWGRCNVKSLMLLPNVLARQQALDRGADDALQYGPGGEVYEATSSNVFIVRGDRVLTPPKGPKILPGITRDFVLERLAEVSLEGDETVLRLDDVFAADEVFLAGTTIEVLGVVAVDERPIGNGEVGPITRRIRQTLFAGESRESTGGG